MASFSCIGPPQSPYWVINELVYSISRLPPNHQLMYISNNHSVLTIQNVSLSNNGSTYQCYLDGIPSIVGILLVGKFVCPLSKLMSKLDI